jgi:hypothetical protein
MLISMKRYEVRMAWFETDDDLLAGTLTYFSFRFR